MQKVPKSRISMKLPVELVEAVEQMGRKAPAPRDLHNMIECCLIYAVWKHSHGTGPDEELSGRYDQWNEKLVEQHVKQHEVQELERIYSMGSPEGEPNPEESNLEE